MTLKIVIDNSVTENVRTATVNCDTFDPNNPTSRAEPTNPIVTLIRLILLKILTIFTTLTTLMTLVTLIPLTTLTTLITLWHYTDCSSQARLCDTLYVYTVDGDTPYSIDIEVIRDIRNNRIIGIIIRAIGAIKLIRIM